MSATVSKHYIYEKSDFLTKKTFVHLLKGGLINTNANTYNF